MLLDCLVIFSCRDAERIFTRELVESLNLLNGRPWRQLAKGKPIDEYWLGRQLRPFAIRSQTLWIRQQSAKGCLKEDFLEPTQRYVSKADWEAYAGEYLTPEPAQPPPTPPAPQSLPGTPLN